MNCSTDEDLFLDKADLPSVISSLKSSTGIETTVKNIKSAVDLLPVFDISTINEDILKHVLPIIVKTLGSILERNDIIARQNEPGVLEELRSNFQIGSSLLDLCTDILNYVLKFKQVAFVVISSLPVNIVQVLRLTFDHCKTSQDSYNAEFKKLAEILEMFKKGQEVHAKFMCLLETHLVFDSLAENDINNLQQVLESMWKISVLLTNINLKSMVDNWKSFTNITENYSDILIMNSFDFKSPILSLIEEIDKVLQLLVKSNGEDAKADEKNVKIVGFLMKIAMKLLDVYKNDQLCTKLLITLHSYTNGLFLYNGARSELVDFVAKLLDPLLERLMSNGAFLKVLSEIDENSDVNRFGLLSLLNRILKDFTQFLVNKSAVFGVCSLVFKCVKHCYTDLFCEHNSELFNDLSCNLAIVILLSPDYYEKIEQMLLSNVISRDIWSILLAIDSWCLVLKHCHQDTIVASFSSLTKWIMLAKFSKYDAIFVKILLERMFNLLPDSVKMQEMGKLKDGWKLIGLNNVPLSQRFYVEDVLNDVFDKTSRIDSNMTGEDLVVLSNHFKLLSNVDFNQFGLNTRKLHNILNRLWSFNDKEMSNRNAFYVHFVESVGKFSKNNIWELSAVDLLHIIRQMQKLQQEPLIKLILSEMMLSVHKRSFNESQELQQVFPLLSHVGEVCLLFLIDPNPMVVEIILRTVHEMAPIFRNKIESSSTAQIKQLIAHSNLKMLNMEYFQSIQNAGFEHKCIEKLPETVVNVATFVSAPSRVPQIQDEAKEKIIADLRGELESEPKTKKIKIDCDIEEALNEVKSGVKKLYKAQGATLDQKQIRDIRSIILKLQNFAFQSE